MARVLPDPADFPRQRHGASMTCHELLSVQDASERFGLVELVVGWAAAELPTRQALALLRRPPAEPDVSLSAHPALQCPDPFGAGVG